MNARFLTVAGEHARIIPIYVEFVFFTDDECALMTDNCDTNAVFTDIPGSFNCTCNEGYNGDGVNCTNGSIKLT